MFIGTYTALVTPFRKRRVDYKALERLIARQVEAKIEGIVPVGTTGESPTLTVPEHIEVIRRSVRFAAGRIKVLAGTGGNSTGEAIYLTREALKVGADGSLQVAPYYNKPTQEGLFQHFRAVADSTRLPIVLYNIPGRCQVSIDVETVVRLLESCKNIVGIKEASGSPDRVSELIAATRGRFFPVLSGDDSLTLPFMAVGAHGVISVASNIIPDKVSMMVDYAKNDAYNLAQREHANYFELFRALFVETNPGPVKAALEMMGLIDGELRLPLVPLNSVNRRKLRKILKSYGLVK
ncbi:MAG TPA: 4-hydroxy-tetrahydrodipicolinate synthase [Candidatus Paceibacterota bacterium]